MTLTTKSGRKLMPMYLSADERKALESLVKIYEQATQEHISMSRMVGICITHHMRIGDKLADAP